MSEFIEVGTVTHNNQAGWDNIVTTGPNVTLNVGTKLYAKRADLYDSVIETIERNTVTAFLNRAQTHGLMSEEQIAAEVAAADTEVGKP